MTGEIQAFFVTTRAANFNAYQSASVFPLVLPQTSNRRAPSLLGVWHAKSMRIPNLVRYRDFFFTETIPTRASLWRWWVVVISSDQALNEKWWLRATYAHDHRWWWWWWRISIFTVSANLTINRTGRYVLCTWSCNNFQHQRNMDETHVGEGRRCMSLQKITHFSTPVGNAYSAALPSRFQAGQNADQV